MHHMLNMQECKRNSLLNQWGHEMPLNHGDFPLLKSVPLLWGNQCPLKHGISLHMTIPWLTLTILIEDPCSFPVFSRHCGGMPACVNHEGVNKCDNGFHCQQKCVLSVYNCMQINEMILPPCKVSEMKAYQWYRSCQGLQNNSSGILMNICNSMRIIGSCRSMYFIFLSSCETIWSNLHNQREMLFWHIPKLWTGR